MARCYDRDRNEKLSLYPCDSDPDADLKSCCAAGESCASNGLCIAPEGKDQRTPYFIHGCTKDNWDDPTCLRQCDGTGEGVKPCGNGKFCCWGYDDCDCNKLDEVFTLFPVKIVASIPNNPSRKTDATSLSSTSTAVTTTTTTTSLEESTGTSESTSTSTAQSESSNNTGSGNALPIGLGVGLGVGITLIAFGIGLVWFMRKRKTSHQPLSEREPQSYVVYQETPVSQVDKPLELHGKSRPAELS